MLNKHLKKIVELILILLTITTTTILLSPISKAMESNKINISAYGAVLIDVNSGRILNEKNADQRMRVASLTKIMTAIVAIENGDLSKMVTTSDNAFGVEGSSIYLKRGEKLSLEDMLYGLMLRSGNDAAVAIAEHIGGSLEGFRYLMNEKAAYLGMNNTHFMNPHGLDHQEHYSTPRDMAVLTAYALKNQTFKKIVSTKVKTAPLAGEKWERKWYNKNRLLDRYQWADGVKTGYTKLSKRCLASSATKNDFQLAAITLNASDDWNDHIRLLEYGFNNFEQVKLIEQGHSLGALANSDNIKLIAKDDFVYPLTHDEKNSINKKLRIDEGLNINGSSIVGKLEIFLKDKYIGSVPVTTKKNNLE